MMSVIMKSHIFYCLFLYFGELHFLANRRQLCFIININFMSSLLSGEVSRKKKSHILRRFARRFLNRCIRGLIIINLLVLLIGITLSWIITNLSKFGMESIVVIYTEGSQFFFICILVMFLIIIRPRRGRSYRNFRQVVSLRGLMVCKEQSHKGGRLWEKSGGKRDFSLKMAMHCLEIEIIFKQAASSCCQIKQQEIYY